MSVFSFTQRNATVRKPSEIVFQKNHHIFYSFARCPQTDGQTEITNGLQVAPGALVTTSRFDSAVFFCKMSSLITNMVNAQLLKMNILKITYSTGKFI